MRHSKYIIPLLCASIAAVAPTLADAQVRIIPNIGGSSFFYRPSTFASYPSPYYAGYGTGYSGAFQNNAYSSSLQSDYYGLNSSAFWQNSYSGPIYFPGWWAGSSNVPRMRSRLEPAVRVPSHTQESVNLASYTPNGVARQTVAQPVAHLEVVLPCQDARVWVQGVAMHQSGTVRQFVTPELTPGCHYNYSVKACWQSNGQPCEQVYTVRVWRGCRTRVNFCP